MAEQNVKSHPGLAAVFSFIFTGLGQIYNGQIIKGLIVIFLSSLSMIIFILGSIAIGGSFLGKLTAPGILAFGIVMFFLGLTCICILGIYSIFDAFETASKQ